ncbi:MAG: hypothetical protein OEN48_16575 [Betaproteobacteria bacterium]|nr:hypothetical protein [Betaproteobacteria bacterium]
MNTSVRIELSEPSRSSQRNARYRHNNARPRAFVGRLRTLLLGLSLAVTAFSAQVASAGEPVKILFIGNSFTHGRFDEVRLYNAENVYDVNCPVEVTFDYPGPGPWADPGSATDRDSDCYPGAEPGSGDAFPEYAGLSRTEQKPDPIPVPMLPLPESPVLADPTETHPIDDLMFYPTMLRYGPYGGIPGLFKKFTDQVGLDYEVAILSQGAATLQSFCRFRSSVGECTDRSPNFYLTKIANAFEDGPPDTVVCCRNKASSPCRRRTPWATRHAAPVPQALSVSSTA